MRIEPYRVDIPDEVLDDLRARLARTRAVGEPEGAGWDYGTSAAYLDELVDYWSSGFDWRRYQEELNRLSHFRADVDGLRIHFVHEALSEGAGRPPVLLLHGWPTGFPEMTRLVPQLAGDFRVVVPSMPGYSFSDAPRVPGYGYHRAAQDLHRVMTEGLGYPKYGVHTTGAGAFVGGWMAIEHPESVVGLHTHDPTLMPPPLVQDPTPAEVAYFERSRRWGAEEGAYAEVHRTKPQSLAPALNDSPAGLAGWLLDKYRTWSDCDGDLESRFSKDDLLAIITTHWVTGDIGSSIRAYYERVHHDRLEPGVRLQVPTGVAMPRDDPRFPSRRAPEETIRRSHDVRHWVDLPRGGHFASWEEPELVAASIRSFFTGLE